MEQQKTKRKTYPRNDYGKMAFPDRTNYFGSFSDVTSTTETDSDRRGLEYWFDGLVENLGREGADEERHRTLIRGRKIDATLDRILEFDELHVAASSLLEENLDDRVVRYYCQEISAKIDRFIPIAAELPVWSYEHRFKGYLDLLAIDRLEDCLVVLDNKGTNKEKPASKRDGHTQQVAAYCVALKEMILASKAGKYKDAVRLFDYLELDLDWLSGLVEDMIGRLVYFVDGKEEPFVFDMFWNEQQPNLIKTNRWKTNLKFRSIDWRFSQFGRKLKKFYQMPVVLLAGSPEGFWKRRWKRCRPDEFLSAEEFDKIHKEEDQATFVRNKSPFKF